MEVCGSEPLIAFKQPHANLEHISQSRPDYGLGLSLFQCGRLQMSTLNLLSRRAPSRQGERIFIELVTSDRTLKASREGSKCQPQEKIQGFSHGVSPAPSVLGLVVPSFRALSGHLKCTVRRHKFNKVSPSCTQKKTPPHPARAPPRLLHLIDSGLVGSTDSGRGTTRRHLPRVIYHQVF